jgi:hypothetical protein
MDHICLASRTRLSRPVLKFQEEQSVTPEQEKQLEHFDTEIQIAEKQLRLSQIKKQIAEIELDIVGLQQTLQQQLGDRVAVSSY